MAEKIAELNKSKHIQTLEINVSNVVLDNVWGSLYYKTQTYDTGLTLTGKKIFANFIPSDNYTALIATRITDNTKIAVQFTRGTTATINGKVIVMVTD